MKKILFYDEVLKAFVISEKEINGLSTVPELVLPESAYKLLNVAQPKENAPTVGFLLGHDAEFYSAGWNYVRSIAKSGAKIRFIDYVNPNSELKGCDGLILPGGSFPSPERYYIDPKEGEGEQKLSPRAFAYIVCIREAIKDGKPILGICAGAQMVAGECGLKMARDYGNIRSDIKLEHKSSELNAHKVFISDQKFKKLLERSWLWTNSRHREVIIPDDEYPLSELKIYAKSEDGVPEAWGNWNKNILCVQWHPEDEASWGNRAMQAIYNWLAMKALEYARK